VKYDIIYDKVPLFGKQKENTGQKYMEFYTPGLMLRRGSGMEQDICLKKESARKRA
jgi:hypothetical protein